MKDLIKIICIMESIWFMILAIIDAVSKESSDPNWLDYITLTFICLGIVGIIDAIEHINDKKSI